MKILLLCHNVSNFAVAICHQYFEFYHYSYSTYTLTYSLSSGNSNFKIYLVLLWPASCIGFDIYVWFNMYII